MTKIPKKWFVLWFTGLSWAWKTIIADSLHKKLKQESYIKIERLDWDIIRENLTKDLWFSKQDRKTNIERVAFVAKLLSRNNVWVISSFISPYESERVMVKNHVTNYIEVFIDAPIDVCENRDTKGLYKKAREWVIPNFTWISDPYEKPVNPNIVLKTDTETIDESVGKVFSYLKENLYI